MFAQGCFVVAGIRITVALRGEIGVAGFDALGDFVALLVGFVVGLQCGAVIRDLRLKVRISQLAVANVYRVLLRRL